VDLLDLLDGGRHRFEIRSMLVPTGHAMSAREVRQAHRLSGVIERDPETEGARPLLIVDGRTFTRDQIGRMLMTFEGFTLTAVVKDSRPRHRGQ
jgi:hypothetical protein